MSNNYLWIFKNCLLVYTWFIKNYLWIFKNFLSVYTWFTKNYSRSNNYLSSWFFKNCLLEQGYFLHAYFSNQTLRIPGRRDAPGHFYRLVPIKMSGYVLPANVGVVLFRLRDINRHEITLDNFPRIIYQRLLSIENLFSLWELNLKSIMNYF